MTAVKVVQNISGPVKLRHLLLWQHSFSVSMPKLTIGSLLLMMDWPKSLLWQFKIIIPNPLKNIVQHQNTKNRDVSMLQARLD
jgi:hypothetical protein